MLRWLVFWFYCGCARVLCIVLSWYVFLSFCFFFFKHKTAYEVRISDWSSDVCSSDLHVERADVGLDLDDMRHALLSGHHVGALGRHRPVAGRGHEHAARDRKSVV